jgi:hypothetical protein
MHYMTHGAIVRAYKKTGGEDMTYATAQRLYVGRFLARERERQRLEAMREAFGVLACAFLAICGFAFVLL